MRHILLSLFIGALSLGFAAEHVEAKRLGGGSSQGMKRSIPPKQATPDAPAQQAPAATPNTAGATAGAAAAPRRSWMGPIAGLAAGLGIAALLSSFGMGGALANILTIALIAMVVMVAIGFFLRRRAANQAGGLAAAGAMGNPGAFRQQEPLMDRSALPASSTSPAAGSGSLIGSRLAGGVGGAVAATGVGSIPAGFDTAGFERTARDQFMALQAANDARDLDRLRDYLSPEMFDEVSKEIAERGDAPQKTEVFGLHTQVVDVAEEADRYIVSVRFSGSIREQFGADTEDLNEVWHLTKPKSGFGGWVIAGIQQA
jgi:predicted lipid-binding transport protein (Tim44 family)